MNDFNILQMVTTIVVASISAAATIIVARIQKPSENSKNYKKELEFLPGLAQYRRPKLFPRIIFFMVIGGVVGFILGGMIKLAPVTGDPTLTTISLTTTPFGSIAQTTVSTTKTNPTINPTKTKLSQPMKSGIGKLSFNFVEGCEDLSFKIIDNSGNNLGGDKIDVGSFVAVGTYNVEIIEFGYSPVFTFKDVKIQEGQDTIIDLSHTFGALAITDIPDKAQFSLRYNLYQANPSISLSNYIYISSCVPAGKYKFEIEQVGLSLEIEIEPGKIKQLTHEIWDNVGLISFSNNEPGVLFSVYEQSSNKYIGQYYAGWLATGNYKIVINKPYIGLTFNNVEIKAGNQTVINLPALSTPTP